MKNMNYKKSIAILLAAILTTSVVSCAANEETTAQTTTTDVTLSAVESEPEEIEIEDYEEKPDVNEYDFNGRTYTFYAENWYNYEPLSITDLYAEEYTGEPINDAAYERNLLISDKMNCNVDVIDSGDTMGFAFVMDSVMAGDNAYDIYLSRGRWYVQVMTSGAVTDITDIPTLNLDKPWWDKKSSSTLAIKKRSFAICGDISENYLLSTFAFFFNKDLSEDYNLGDFYAMVENGTWTLDTLFSMCRIVSSDLNFDGKYTRDDRFGFTYMQEHALGLLNACDVTIIKNDSEGIPQITLKDNDGVTKMLKIIEFLSDDTTSYNFHARSPSNLVYTDEVGMFMNRNAVFSLGAIYHTPELRLMDDEFGIIPYPKYDESQRDYVNPVDGANLSIVTFPRRSDEGLSDVGIFAEYYAYLGNKVVRPALYNVLLQGKVARDEESSAMLDMIFNNLTFDVGYVADYGGIATKLCDMFYNRQSAVASNIERFSRAVQGKVDDIVEKVATLN